MSALHVASSKRRIPGAVVAVAALALLVHGPIAQPEAYHAFADRRAFAGIGNAGDVLSNLGFALVGAWGLAALGGQEARRALGASWSAWMLFSAALVMTAAGSAYYHLAPGNGTLVWDRLPIALACAALLAAMRARTVAPSQSPWVTPGLALAAIASVAWWALTERWGSGDLRPYLMMQAAPLVIAPMWQAIAGAPREERLAFALAILLYVGAKAAEMADRPVLEATGLVSGHTIKHLLATVAAAVLVRIAVRPSTRTSSSRRPAASA
jgi:hypothetical protein